MIDYNNLMEAHFRCGIEAGKGTIVEETIKDLFSKADFLNKGVLLSELYNALTQWKEKISLQR